MQAADRYWLAVTREIELKCRCTTFTSAGTMLDCICSGDQPPDSSQLNWRLPSRIPEMINELRCILKSLIPSLSHQDGLESDYDVAIQHQNLSNVLDTNFIVQQIEHGVLDIGSLAAFLGETLKMHCAPMRDELVDNMVQQFGAGPVAQGLQMAFDILEMMKLVSRMPFDAVDLAHALPGYCESPTSKLAPVFARNGARL